MKKDKKHERGIHLSEREARQGNSGYEHIVVAGAMVVIALLIVGVFLYAGFGEGTTKLGEPDVGPGTSEVTSENTGESVPGARQDADAQSGQQAQEGTDIPGQAGAVQQSDRNMN